MISKKVKFRLYFVKESQLNLSREMKKTENVIRNFLRDPSGYGTAKVSGRPSKLSKRDKRRIIRKASNSTLSCADIGNNLNLDVSRCTIWRTLKQSSHLIWSKLISGPYLKEHHKAARLEFARKSMARNWKMVK